MPAITALGATPDDVPAAFTRYERVLRPQTDRAQGFVMPRIAHPQAGWQRSLLRGGLRVLAGPVGTALSRFRTTAPPVDTITLPGYPDHSRAAA